MGVSRGDQTGHRLTSGGCDRVEGRLDALGRVAEIQAASSFPLLLCFLMTSPLHRADTTHAQGDSQVLPICRAGQAGRGTWPWQQSLAGLVGEFLMEGVRPV